MANPKTVRLRIEGRVQGVWYRAWTQGEAQKRGLTGWVRNRSNGSVEALVSGPADAVDSLIAACHQGPPAARVDRVDVTSDSDDGTVGFQTRPTV